MSTINYMHEQRNRILRVRNTSDVSIFRPKKELLTTLKSLNTATQKSIQIPPINPVESQHLNIAHEIYTKLEKSNISYDFLLYLVRKHIPETIAEYIETCNQNYVPLKERASLDLVLPSHFNINDILNFTGFLKKLCISLLIKFSPNQDPHKLKIRKVNSNILSHNCLIRDTEDLLKNYYYNILYTKGINPQTISQSIKGLTFQVVNEVELVDKIVVAVFIKAPLNNGVAKIDMTGLSTKEVASIVSSLEQIKLKVKLCFEITNQQVYLSISIAQK